MRILSLSCIREVATAERECSPTLRASPEFLLQVVLQRWAELCCGVTLFTRFERDGRKFLPEVADSCARAALCVLAVRAARICGLNE